MGKIAYIRRTLFGRWQRQWLRRPPRYQFRELYKLEEISYDISRVFGTVHARSPANVRALMKKYRVESVDELLALLPDNRYHVDPRLRFRLWMMRIFGERDYDMTTTALLSEQKRARRVPDDNILGVGKPRRYTEDE